MASKKVPAKKHYGDTDGADVEFADRNKVDNFGRFDEAPVEREAKGEAKRRALQLERLAEQLVGLKPGQLVRVAMPDELREGVIEAQRLRDKRAFGGYRRQIQRLGVIMRHTDAEPVAASLERLKEEGTASSAAFKAAERWRERLLDEGDAAITALCDERPNLDRTALRQLARAAGLERARQQTSPQTPSTAQKKLFRVVREGLEDPVGGNGGVDAAG